MKYIKDISSFSLPLIINSCTSIIYGILLLGLVSNAPGDITLVVLAINSLNYIIIGALGYISSAFQIVLGNSNTNESNIIFSSTIVSTIVIWICYFILLLVFGNVILTSYLNLEGAVLDNGRIYLVVSNLGTLLVLICFVFNAKFKMLGNTKIILNISIIASVLSILLLSLVIKFKPSIMMISLWSLTQPVITFCLSYWYLLQSKITFSLKCSLEYVKRIVKNSLLMSLQEIFDTTIILICIEGILANLDHTVYQGYLITNQLLTYLLIPLYMVTAALYTYIPRTIASARDKRGYIKTVLYMNATIYIVGFIVMIILGEQVIELLSADFMVATEAVVLIKYVFGASVLMPVYITLRALIQIEENSSKIIMPTLIINIFTVVLLLITDSTLEMFGLVFINYLVLSISFYVIYRINKANDI
ncbi:hypothetical protein RZE82_08790 [Mollicutes bacterium LVI A0039]|nr:hypothetical protein RZE82_08790 [Mollicutes bacterium LVI A0039]